MSSKPPKSDFEATEAEKMQASIAKAEKDYFNQTYSPLLREMRDISMKEDFSAFAAGRGQADTMQALTNKPSLRAARSVDMGADLASAAIGQAVQARGQGLAAQRNRQIGVLATARGQQADATTGLANIAKLEASDNLQQAKRRQLMREARSKAAGQIGGTMLAQGITNIQDGGSFFKPAGGTPSLSEGFGNLVDSKFGGLLG